MLHPHRLTNAVSIKGMRYLISIAGIYVTIIGFLWLRTTTRVVDDRFVSSTLKPHGPGAHLGLDEDLTSVFDEMERPHDQDVSSEAEQGLDPMFYSGPLTDRWLCRPQPRYPVHFCDGNSKSADEYYDLCTDKVTPNNWIIDEYRAGKMDEFKWQDIVDLSAVSRYDNGELNGRVFPYLSLTDFENIDMPYTEVTSAEEYAMIGRLYVKHKMPAPYQLIALPDPTVALRAKIPPVPERFRIKPVDSARCHHQHAAKECSELESIPPITLDLDGTPYSQRGIVRIPESAFNFDPFALAESLVNGTTHVPSQLAGHSIMTALKEVGESKKFFNEVKVIADRALGSHYDWRFFRGFLTEEQSAMMKERLMRAWSQFADAEGISYWISHGSLIGWFWNGLTMPWDSDNDIQMPVMELDRMAREYNGSLVIQHPSEGTGKFLIDVSPWYVQRVKGNGKNFIDGRFIDIETGAYIDITGITKHGVGAKPYGCKNNHFYPLDAISTIYRSLYEGAPTYIPSNLNGLPQEYKNFDKSTFRSWYFDFNTRLWIRNSTCEAELKGRLPFSPHTCIGTSKLKGCNAKASSMGTCDQRLLEAYNKTRDRTMVRLIERGNFDKNDRIASPRPTRELLKLLSKYYPPVGFR